MIIIIIFNTSELAPEAKKNQLTLNNYFAKPCQVDKFKKQNFDEAVLQFIVEDGRSFETASGSGFKSLCSTLSQSAYTPPHPTTLSRRLTDLCIKCEILLQDKLNASSADKLFSLTFDHWKSDNQYNFLVTSLHYICKDWKMEEVCLGVTNFESVNANHSASATARIIENQINKFGINKSSLFFCTTDTTNTMPCTAKLLDVCWQPCSAHLLQQSINKALNFQSEIKSFIHQRKD